MEAMEESERGKEKIVMFTLLNSCQSVCVWWRVREGGEMENDKS